MPFDPPVDGEMRHYVPCPICAAHPGWAHDDERARSEPLDVCKACFGSGRIYDDTFRVDIVLNQAARFTADAALALSDEREGDFTLSVKRLANCSEALSRLVATW